MFLSFPLSCCYFYLPVEFFFRGAVLRKHLFASRCPCLIKLCGKYDNVLTRIIAAPGLWFQRLTVKEPTDKMMEAAIAAMKAVIPENGEDIIR